MIRYRIDLDSVNREDFNVDERFIENFGPVYLVVPKKSKHVWKADELHLRSLLCRPDGTIVSSGFPKFRNFGEDEETDQRVISCVEGPEIVMIPEKMDGSFIIRSVLMGLDGKPFVHLRTRGSHNLGDFYEPVMEVVRQSDPDFMVPFSDSECLGFEFTSPDNKIILDYEKPALTLLGAMFHYEDRPPVFGLADKESNESWADMLGVNSLKFHSFEGSMKDIVDDIRDWKDSEGVVMWCHTGEEHLQKIDGAEVYSSDVILVKVKSYDYLRKHSLRYYFNEKKLMQLCYAGNIENLDDLRDALYSFGIDWETVMTFRPDFELLMSAKKKRKSEILNVVERFLESGITSLSERKDVAISTKKWCESLGLEHFFSVCMAAATGNKESFDRFVDSYSLGIKVGQLKEFKKSGKALFEGVAPFVEEINKRFEQ